MTPIERRITLLLAFIYAIRMFGLFMILPVFALYAADRYNASPILIGIGMGIYGLTQSLFQIPFGIASDRWGRKPVIVIGLFIFAVGSLIAAWAETIEWVIVGRALQGTGAIAAAVMALLADLIPEDHRLKAMALIGSSIGLAFIAAMIVSPLLIPYIGLVGLFQLTALLAMVGVVVIVWTVPQPRRSPFHHDTEVETARFSAIFANPHLMRLNGGVFTLHLTLTANFVAIPLLLTQSGLVSTDHWQLYGIVLPLAMVAIVPFIIVAEKRRQIRRTFLAAVAVVLCAQGGLALLHHHFWPLVGLMGLYFCGFYLLEALLPSMVSKYAPPASRGTAMGLFASSQFFGAFIGGLLGGTLFHYWGAVGPFLLSSGLVLLWLLLAQKMAEPRYLSTRLLHVGSLTSAEAEQMTRTLASLAGVAEVEVNGTDETAYLKVDLRLFEEQSLHPFSIPVKL